MARPRAYRVELTDKERGLVRRVQKTTPSMGIRCRCAVLLNADGPRGAGRAYAELASMSGVTEPTAIATLRDFCEGGVAAALSYSRNPNSDTARLKADGEAEARIVAMACGPPPEGRARWTLRLLADGTASVLEEPLSKSTVQRVLARNELHPHLDEYWCIPPEEDAEFVAAMEDVLDLYQRPFDPGRPLWCMDEKPYQLLGESRDPLPMRPGDARKVDSEYVRNGTASVFCFMQPHKGTIVESVEPTRTAVDWAEKIRYLVDVVEPDAEVIPLVMDNLNVHRLGSLYKAFPPDEARRIASRIEVHYTPKHGSWLDVAEIGINIMTRECLGRRIPGIDELRSELDAWCDAYNADPTPVDWQFTSDDARVKLRRLYPDVGRHRRERDERRERKAEGR